MPLPTESPIDTTELMARVRAALGPGDATHDGAPAAPVVLSPHFHHEQLLLDQAQRVANVGTAIPPFAGLPRLLRPVARLTTWVLHRLLQVITVDQRVFNGLLLNVVRMASAGLAQGEAALNARLSRGETATAAAERRIGELQAAIADLRTAVAAREREQAALAEQLRAGDDDAVGARPLLLERRLDSHHAALAGLQQRVAAAQAGVAAQERRLITLGEAARPALPAPSADGPSASMALVDEAGHALDALYVDFEERFRGSADEIRERLRVYLPDVRAVVGTSAGEVLDLGCGRGEWLSLLGEEGIGARGIDANRVVVAQCRAAGLAVIEGDVFQILAAQTDASTDVVTGFHLIEHLDYHRLVELLDHAVRVLRPGGLLILETPNPDNVLVGSNQFYLDPTHRHPLPSPLVKFLAEARGLRDVEVRPLHPAPAYLRFAGPADGTERLNDYFFGPRDYAVLGHRA